MSDSRKVVLSLEDNPDITSLIRLVLRHAPVDVMQAQSVDEAWSQMERRAPDLVLLDMMLPGTPGLDFLARLRNDPRYKAVPVIVLTIRSDASFRRGAQELGVFRYLLKPFSPAVLREEVAQALGVNWKEYWPSARPSANDPQNESR